MNKIHPGVLSTAAVNNYLSYQNLCKTVHITNTFLKLSFIYNTVKISLHISLLDLEGPLNYKIFLNIYEKRLWINEKRGHLQESHLSESKGFSYP